MGSLARRYRSYISAWYAHAESKPDTSRLRSSHWRIVLGAAHPVFPTAGRTGALHFVIEAPSFDTALAAFDLARACHALIHAGPEDLHDPCALLPADPDEIERLQADDRLPRLLLGCASSNPTLAGAWLMAARVQRSRRHIFAVHTLALSYDTATLLPMDQHLSFPRPTRAYEQTRFAKALVMAHDAIEELGLEARGSPSQPSLLPDRSPNPVVVQDLESRLTERQVDIRDPARWHRRGTRRLEAVRPFHDATRAPWAYRWNTDVLLPLSEAIMRLDWLRDKHAAHSVRTRSGNVTIHDVVNSQEIARRLVFESLGLWTPQFDWMEVLDASSR